MKKILLIIILSNFIFVSFGVKIFLLTQNNLKNNGNWNISKLELEKGVLGAQEFFTKTQSLDKQKLHLGKWHGFQGVISKEKFNYSKIELDVFFEEDSYFYLIFNKDLNESKAIRLSSNDKFSNKCLKILNSGEFSQQQDLDLPQIAHNSWNNISLELFDKEVSIKVNNQSATCAYEINKESQISLKGSLVGVDIDNIIIKKGNEVIFKEDFSYNKNFLLITFFIFIPISLIEILIIRKKKNIFKFFLLLNLSIILSLSITYVFFTNYFTGNYPNIKSVFFKKIKEEETDFIKYNLEELNERLSSKFLDSNNKKIMFVGSSQTFGSGAKTKSDTFVSVFEKLLNQRNKGSISDNGKDKLVLGVSIDKADQGKLLVGENNQPEDENLIEVLANRKIDIINTSVQGASSKTLVDAYIKDWINMNPNIVIINFGSNDWGDTDISEDDFRNNLDRFIKINKEKNIKIILILEPNTLEINYQNPYHDVLREVSENNKISLIDLQGYLDGEYDTGLLWWDNVHLTSYGQKIVGTYIYQAIFENEN
jgi:lysophospholipase L1-like esterase